MQRDEFIAGLLFLDLEAKEDRIFQLGAFLGARCAAAEKSAGVQAALAQLAPLAGDARILAGHNLIAHDRPVLQAVAPAHPVLALPVIDTLLLSALAFPRNPYHALIKDYKLVKDSINDPLADARLSARLLADEWDALLALQQTEPDLVVFYRFGLDSESLPEEARAGFRLLFDALGTRALDEAEAAAVFERYAARHACRSAAASILQRVKAGDRIALAYALAWLQVAGQNSVLPAWTRHHFEALTPILNTLCDIPCTDHGCAYCAANHDAHAQLKKFFGFEGFRQHPVDEDGSSLQERIVRHGLADRPLLAILPTGAGKSLCYQIPALARHFRRGFLTIVITPLQALMKDQVDNLALKTNMLAAGALNGLLTPPERGETLTRVRLGDLALLYVSPEQLRNKSFRNAIRQREIGCWVFDEAHCLSKWGHDFRPDYLYAARFIRELAVEMKQPPPPVACYTATAKKEVLEEIAAHFRAELGQELAIFRGNVERENLHFEVQTVAAAEKWPRVHQILSDRLPGGTGSAVVYTATRNGAELVADYLAKQGWSARAFHAGLNPPAKREIQDAFVSGLTRVICATNAFGMGIDKDNVRLVIHADIPGSLENYIQEAGRAGRDQAAAHCILLFDEQDVETQFGLGARSRLTQRDIYEILKGLRRARRNERGEIVITTGELLRDEALDASFDSEDHGADVKVRTAIAALERAEFIQRNLNESYVFQGRPLVSSLAEAETRIDRLKLPPRQKEQWMALLASMINAPPDEGMNADTLAELPEFRSAAVHENTPAYGTRRARESDTSRIMRILHEMAEAGLIKRDLLLTAFVRVKGVNNAYLVLKRVGLLEQAMLALMREEAPDAEGWMNLSLRQFNQRLLETEPNANPGVILRLLKSLAQDGRSAGGAPGSFDIRALSHDHYRVRLLRDWDTACQLAERRRGIAAIALQTIAGKAGADPAVGELLLAFSANDVLDAISSDLTLGPLVKDRLATLEHALMYLHEQRVIILQQGLAVFRQAMTINILPGRSKDRFTRSDYNALETHYDERVFQVHVIHEYARLGLDRIRQALAFVAAYFTLGREEFIRRYFSDRKQMLDRATGAASYDRIVTALRNPVQTSLVAENPAANLLVLAGPGSGKTRVVAHRCAYLLRVLRVPARAILILCFNHHAALTLRRRLVDLVGPDARGVTVKTYHGFAMQLTGASFADRDEPGKTDSVDFDEYIRRAIRLLRGEDSFPGLETDEARDRLLTGFRHILVDEYQDIDELQYELVSAIAGRTLEDPDAKLAIMAVGDDDQNIYTFRGTNVRYIRQFQQDYDAELHYLVENYRSTGAIIGAANEVIRHNRDRMKGGHPIRINSARSTEPAGGKWANLDPVAQGRVEVLTVQDAAQQAVAIIEEIRRLQALDPKAQPSHFAVLARTSEELAPIRAACEHRALPVWWNADRQNQPPARHVREIAALLDLLRERPAELMKVQALQAHFTDTSATLARNPWCAYRQELLQEMADEFEDNLQPVPALLEFLYEALAEREQHHGGTSGIFLATLHAAKGLEFPHVFIAGGGWRSQGNEEERRVFYVGLTRARETLHLLQRADQPQPFIREIGGEHTLTRAGAAGTIPPDVLCRKYAALGMADLFLAWPAGQPPGSPVHKILAQLQPGDRLFLHPATKNLVLKNSNQQTVACLSAAASETWKPRLPLIEQAHITAMIRLKATPDVSDYLSSPPQLDTWEVPLIEIVWHPE